jgi:hypothetical protein
MNAPTKPSISAPAMARSRRDVLKGAGTALAALALTAASPMAAGRAFASETLQIVNDTDVLNFALTLEYLEATFYEQVVAGGQLGGDVLRYLTVIRDHENAHINEITRLINERGGTPVQRQNVYNFGDLSSQRLILEVAQRIEQVGVGAYTGAARLFTDKTGLLAAAAGIQQVESRHAALIRYLRNEPIAASSRGPIYTTDETNALVAPILGR